MFAWVAQRFPREIILSNVNLKKKKKLSHDHEKHCNN